MAKIIQSQRNTQQTSQAVGAGIGLVGTFVAAIFFAAMLSRVAVYVTFLMPILAGMLIAAAGSLGPRRFGYGNTKMLVVMMVAGAVVAWAGHHTMSYLNLMNYISTTQMTAEGGQVLTASEAASNFLHEATGQRGFWAYLTYVSEAPGSEVSPIGLLGRKELGAPGTVVVALVELALFIAAAVGSMLMRTRHIRLNQAPEAFAQLDAASFTQLTEALDERNFQQAGKVLAAPVANAPAYFVAMNDGELSSEILVYVAKPDDALGELALKRIVPRVGADQLRASFVQQLSEGV